MYFRAEKARMERKRITEATKGIGKPNVGGSFDLVDHDGNRFTDEDMKGKYALVSHTSFLQARCRPSFYRLISIARSIMIALYPSTYNEGM